MSNVGKALEANVGIPDESRYLKLNMRANMGTKANQERDGRMANSPTISKCPVIKFHLQVAECSVRVVCGDGAVLFNGKGVALNSSCVVGGGKKPITTVFEL